jgi:hypothetical protein
MLKKKIKRQPNSNFGRNGAATLCTSTFSLPNPFFLGPVKLLIMPKISI